MKTILLFRHAPPDFPDGLRRCIGSRTDVAASAAGLAAAAERAPLLRAAEVRSVWSSPLLRCRQTAAALAGTLPCGVHPGLAELDCGEWDGLSFDEIRARYPEEYARRGADGALPPPGGEAPEQAAARGLAALRELAEHAEGSLAAVGHAGINRAMLCVLLGLPMAQMRTLPQPYLCVNILRYAGGQLSVAAVGRPTDAGSADPLFPIKEELHHEETV